MKSRSALVVFALSLTLTAPVAFAKENSGGALAGFFARILYFFDGGGGMDPNGAETDSRGGWDPNGFAIEKAA